MILAYMKLILKVAIASRILTYACPFLFACSWLVKALLDGKGEFRVGVGGQDDDSVNTMTV